MVFGKNGNSTVNDFLVIYFELFIESTHNLNMIQSYFKDIYCILKSDMVGQVMLNIQKTHFPKCITNKSITSPIL